MKIQKYTFIFLIFCLMFLLFSTQPVAAKNNINASKESVEYHEVSMESTQGVTVNVSVPYTYSKEIPKVIQTGDDASIMPYVLMAFFSGSFLLLYYINKKRTL